MKILVSTAMSVDGFIDDRSPKRLVLSGPEDSEDVLRVRARCDAILVGAGTIRRDDPALVTRSDALARRRLVHGLPEDPIKITLTRSGDLGRDAAFFRLGQGTKIVYCPASRASDLKQRFGSLATIVPIADERLDVGAVADDLQGRGIRRLLVEGGTSILTAFFAAGLVDELRLAIAPFFAGVEGGARFVDPASFPHSPARRMKLAGVRRLGDTAVVRYRLDRVGRT